MPPACSLLGKATPAPPEVQPFRFLDLPIEIRYMVYEEFLDKDVTVTVHGLNLPTCVSCGLTQVPACLHPAMLRVNKQLATEYAAVAVPRMVLFTNWRTCDHDTPHGEMQSNRAQPSMLPETTLANLSYLFLRMNLDASTPHCDVQAAIQMLTSRMLQLRFLVFSSEYDINPLVRETRSADPTEFGKHREWTDEMIYLLQNLVDEENSSWIAMAKFHIICPLYSVLDSPAEDERVSDVVFAICEDPEEDTFKLGGLDLKFLGTDRVEVELKAARDFNIVIQISPRADDEEDEMNNIV